MSRFSYETYGERARTVVDPTQATARLLITKAQERSILYDVIHKLDIKPEDRLLDIGCGIGQLGIPLSFMVESYTGIDHPDVIRRFSARYFGENVELIGGNFLDIPLQRKFTKILAYSVIHYLSADDVPNFVGKSLPLLEDRGRMLIGDVPNSDERKRFFRGAYGQFFDAAWCRDFDKSLPKELDAIQRSPMSHVKDDDTVNADDAWVLGLAGGIRKAGFSCWVLPQPDTLPIWFQREDLLVIRP